MNDSQNWTATFIVSTSERFGHYTRAPITSSATSPLINRDKKDKISGNPFTPGKDTRFNTSKHTYLDNPLGRDEPVRYLYAIPAE
jgi:hypothetical protein